MGKTEGTRWTVIRDAAEGHEAGQGEFVRRYEPAVKAYLRARWQGSPMLQEVDDIAQEVFVQCFKPEGALAHARSDRPGGFRAYFYGVVRNVARMAERKRARQRVHPARESFGADRLAADDDGLSTVFDRAWSIAMVQEARDLLAAQATDKADGEAAVRRVELLRLRFQQGLPIREIARTWHEDPARLHHEYAKARREFQDALREVVSLHHPGSVDAVEQRCEQLLDFLA